jgi:chromosome segregation ATPase
MKNREKELENSIRSLIERNGELELTIRERQLTIDALKKEIVGLKAEVSETSDAAAGLLMEIKGLTPHYGPTGEHK